MKCASSCARYVERYLTTVDEIEQKTGYDFLNTLPEDIQTIIEAKKDN